MVGRDAELLRIAGLARDAAAGRGRLVLIEGEPGIGKTLLLRAALNDAAGLFPRRLTGAAEELDQRWPFATIRACLEPLAAGDQRVTDMLASVRGGVAEYPISEALLALVEEWCAASPVVVAIDDLQWADPASILLLHGLGRVAGQLPLLLAATVRSGAGRRDVDAMARSWRGYDAEQITLGPLAGPALHQLVATLAGGQPGPGLRGLVDGAAGNPLYVTELVTGLASHARLRTRSDAAVDLDPAAPHAAIPPTLRAAVAQRLALLSAGTRELLQTAALLGTTFSVAELAAVLGRPATELLGHLSEAIDGGVLSALPDRLAFRHPLVRAVLDDELPPSARQALHLQLAQTLTTTASPERVAEHLLAAGPAAVSLLPWLGGVADDLAAHAPALAADLLGQVLETAAGSGGEPVPRLRAALAAALLRSGRPERAEQAARSALATPVDPRVEAALRWTLANACASQGAMDRAVEEIGIALATGRLTLGEQARFHGLNAQCHITLSQPTDATTAWQSSVAAAQASGDIQALAHGMAAGAGARGWDGWIEEALISADAAVTATEALGPRAGAQLAPQIHRGIYLTELDRDAEAEQAFEAALKLAEHGVGTDFLPWRYQCVARLRFLQGRWDEALADVQAGLDLPDRLDMGRHLRGTAALIAVHRGDRAALAGLLPFLRAPAPPTSPGRQSAATPTWALAAAAHAEGRTGQAVAVLGPAWGEDIDRDQLRYLRHYLVPDLVAYTVTAGDLAAARRVAASIERYASPRSSPSLHRSGRHARALADQDPAALEQVAEDHAHAGRVLFAAQAHEQAAPLLAAAGQARRARAAALAALAGYESLEAGWDLARAEAVLRRLGMHRGVRGPRRRPKTGWDALTDTERVVAGLVAEGYSNPHIAARMFLSRRTVQGHVSSILAKLDVASRVELAAVVVRRTATSG